VAIAGQQGVHMPQQDLHLTIAAASSVVDCHLAACHLIKHHLHINTACRWIAASYSGLCNNRDTQGEVGEAAFMPILNPQRRKNKGIYNKMGTQEPVQCT